METKHRLFSIILSIGLAISIVACSTSSNTSSSNNLTKVNKYVLTASEQTSCYDNNGKNISTPEVGDAFYGQDANYLKGKKMSYINNGDGTITDKNTGLMWQEIPTSEGFTWKDAVKYCKKLKLAGYGDWRIPSVKELYSISDFGRSWPYLDTNYFKLATGHIDKSEQFWSSDKYVGVTAEGHEYAAFGVNHVTGHIKAYPSGEGMNMHRNSTPPPPHGNGPQGTAPAQNNNTPPSGANDLHRPMGNPMLKHVRAVRGESYGENDFIDNGDSTVSDRATGLMWAQNDNGKGLDWENALIYAENSNLAGYTDWRLPNVKELQSIVDYNYAPGAQNIENEGPAINPLFSCTEILNEAKQKDYGYYWTSTSAQFTSGEAYFYAWYIAFGRAVNQEGTDFHGAGAVRFDTKYEGGALGEGGERYYNFVRLVRDI